MTFCHICRNSHILYVISRLNDSYYRVDRVVNEFQIGKIGEIGKIMRCTRCRITGNPQDMFYMEGMSFCFSTKGKRELYHLGVDPIGVSVCV